MHGDDGEPHPPRWMPGKAYGDTRGGDIGAEFVVDNADTPADNRGTRREFGKHVYKVTGTETSTTGTLLIYARHVRPADA